MGVINGIGNNVKDIYYDGKKIGTVYANGKVLYRSQTSQIVIDPTYNYYVFDVSKTDDNTITLQENKAGDTTAWDGYTDWGDGTVSRGVSHTYKRKGIYIVKTKWMINSVYTGGGYDTSDYKSKEALVGCKNINVNITIFASLFYDCCYMRYADLSRLDVSNVESMKDMFYHCFSLKKLNLDGWDTSNVQDMSGMFDQCAQLKPQVSHFNTSKVTNMRYMFYGCQLDGSHFKNWNVSKVTNTAYMFGSTDITNRLDLSGWNVSKVSTCSYMFSYCKANDGIDISNWNIDSTIYFLNTIFDDLQCGDDTCSDIEHHVTHVGVSDDAWNIMARKQ